MKKLNSSGNVVQYVSIPPSRVTRLAMRIAKNIFEENFEKYRLNK